MQQLYEDLCAPGYTDAPSPVKGAPLRVFSQQSLARLSDDSVDVRAFNAVNVEVLVTGTNPSGVISVEGGPEKGGDYLPLDDPEASQTVTVSTSFDVIVGTTWAKIRLADVSGTFGNNQGFTVTVTAYLAPSLGRPAITVGS